MRKLSTSLISIYRMLISPFLPPCCRFYPTCSDYMSQSIEKYGVFKGLCMGTRRILRCHPLCEGGMDPVP